MPIRAILLALVTATALAACGGDDDDDDSPTAASSPTEVAAGAATEAATGTPATVASEAPTPVATSDKVEDDATATLDDETDSSDGDATSSPDVSPVFDDSFSVWMEVPADWTDTSTDPWVVDGVVVGPGISASPDVESFVSTWDTPGAFFGASEDLVGELTIEEVLNENNFEEECTLLDRNEFNEGLFPGMHVERSCTGEYDVYTACGGTDTGLIVLSAMPADRPHIVLLQIQIAADEDVEALDLILATFTADLLLWIPPS